MSYVYLLHFSKPIGTQGRGQAQHYLGYTGLSLKKRLSMHKAGTGAKICRAAIASGIELNLVRHWSNGTRSLERQLKRQHNSPRLCPVCNNRQPTQSK
ncbi:GIY-YIG nuclease family protein [Nostoc sp. PA-18-2419]|uniref:GIY-YIG nuclease family protein n=1 Tax=Nostoc sp. PA-18-2419 TaxID=2575443 RepID=UPI001107B826|nr:GIY-YIG nuclease family protein [Nostoc sp. PA-18-2419]